MGDPKTLAKARMELEELYLGVPDESVNLTFQDLVDVQQKANASTQKKEHSPKNIDPVQEAKIPKQESALAKLPSLDFNRGLQAAKANEQYHHQQHLQLKHPLEEDEDDAFDSHMGHHHHDHHHHHHHHYHDGDNMHAWQDHGYGFGDQSHNISPRGSTHAVERSMAAAYGDVSIMSMASGYHERGQRRRPGIPHSNICTICSTYIYIFRYRCLVCGRVYCRQCVSMGMGEMTEGRKCIQCLGRRFSQRYIKRAGKVGCCLRYPSTVKQAELKWAEKGPRRSGERAYGGGHSEFMSRSRSPMTPGTPRRGHSGRNTPSFVASSTHSPYIPTNHHLPL